jgi:hypothetical protein
MSECSCDVEAKSYLYEENRITIERNNRIKYIVFRLSQPLAWTLCSYYLSYLCCPKSFFPLSPSPCLVRTAWLHSLIVIVRTLYIRSSGVDGYFRFDLGRRQGLAEIESENYVDS